MRGQKGLLDRVCVTEAMWFLAECFSTSHYSPPSFLMTAGQS